MKNRLSTTTYRRRNFDELTLASQIIGNIGVEKPRIVDIGPGGIVYFFNRVLPEGRSEEWSCSERFLRNIFRPIETVFRKTGLFPLATFEPLEILDTFGELNPTSLDIVDKEPKVIRAAQKLLSPFDTEYDIRYKLADITKERPICEGDLVFAFSVLQRISNNGRACDILGDYVSPRGFLITNYEMKSDSFSQVGKNVYRKN